MPNDSSTDPSALSKLLDKIVEIVRMLSSTMRLAVGLVGVYALWYDSTYPDRLPGWAVFTAMIASGIGLWTLGNLSWAAWTAWAATRPNTLADRADNLADRFARCQSWADMEHARPVVREMVRLRDDLIRWQVYIYVESAIQDHPASIIEACKANEKTLRRLAELMRAGDLRTARAEFPKTS